MIYLGLGCIADAAPPAAQLWRSATKRVGPLGASDYVIYDRLTDNECWWLEDGSLWTSTGS